MKVRRYASLFVIMMLLLCLAPFGHTASAAADEVFQVKQLESTDIMEMPYEERVISFLDAEEGFFFQKWGGVPLDYLMNVEIGMRDAADDTVLTFHSASGESVSISCAELERTYPSSFYEQDGIEGNDTIFPMLAWRSAVEAADAAGADQQVVSEIGETSGPFVLVVPQETEGGVGSGTVNADKLLANVRTISVETSVPGATPEPSEVPASNVVAYGNIFLRETITYEKLEAMVDVIDRPYTRTNDETGTYDTYRYSGVSLDYLFNTYLANSHATILPGSDILIAAGDNFSKVFTWDQATSPSSYARQLLPDAGDRAILATTEEYVAPVNGTGGVSAAEMVDVRMKAVRPLFDENDGNTSCTVVSTCLIRIGDTVDNGLRGTEVDYYGDGTKFGAAPDRLVICSDQDGAVQSPDVFRQRDLSEALIKGMPYTEAVYSCLKDRDPFTFFYQKWGGVSLEYLLEVEVGMKNVTDATRITFTASDGASRSISYADLKKTYANDLVPILAWRLGDSSQAVTDPGEAASADMLDIDDETANGSGPFRLVVPQEIEGEYGVGTPNYGSFLKNIRSIKIETSAEGTAPAPGKISRGELVVYGNIWNRQSVTYEQIRSLPGTSGTFSSTDSSSVDRNTFFEGAALSTVVKEVVDASGATTMKVVAKDHGTETLPWQSAVGHFDYDPNGNGENNRTILAWSGGEGSDIDEGTLRLVVPQAAAGMMNRNLWIKEIRVINFNNEDRGIREEMVPSDRIILCGDFSTSIPSEWYLAEGYTGAGWEEYISIQNPECIDADVTCTLMVEGDNAQKKKLVVPAASRATVNVNEVVGTDKNVSAKVVREDGGAIVVERAMYWGNKTGGHAAAAVSAPAKTWYLAEGCTANGFETWVLIQNPNLTPTTATVTYMNAQGEEKQLSYQVAANSRKTVNVSEGMSNELDVSTRVTATQPVIVERSMYWKERKAGHDAVGLTDTARRWYLAEGCTANGFETWVLMQNPGANEAVATITYMTPEGTVDGGAITLAPGSRRSVNVASVVPNETDVSTMITSDVPITVERSVYWNDRSGGTCETASAATTYISRLAEGCTADGFETWILLQNPNDFAVTAFITYLTGTGTVRRAPVTIGAGQRLSVNAGETVKNNYNLSTRIDASAGIVVERAVYWGSRIEAGVAKGYPSFW